MKAKRVTDLQAAGERIRQGNLVSFPTETVYGLGCNAMDEQACRKVFHAKERPLTDPLISHVLEPVEAFRLWSAPAESTERRILEQLCRSFWPGPLTIVAKAAPDVPSIVMAGTGYCACRSPSHPVARELLSLARVPVAAPSANKFGHVSPTTADHVYHDLQHEDVWIVENRPDTPCNIGVESSVAKVQSRDDGTFLISVLRQGAVSVFDIQECLEEFPCVEIVAHLKQATDESVANVAPGQTIRHYSPNIPSYIVSTLCETAVEKDVLSSCVLVDYGGQLIHWRDEVLSYVDLSAKRDSQEAAQKVFEILRWAENVAGAKVILLPDIDESSENALEVAVKDRLTRAASGVTISKLSDVKNGNR